MNILHNIRNTLPGALPPWFALFLRSTYHTVLVSQQNAHHTPSAKNERHQVLVRSILAYPIPSAVNERLLLRALSNLLEGAQRMSVMIQATAQSQSPSQILLLLSLAAARGKDGPSRPPGSNTARMEPITYALEGSGEKEPGSETMSETADACASMVGHSIATATMKTSTVSSQRVLSFSQNACVPR